MFCHLNLHEWYNKERLNSFLTLLLKSLPEPRRRRHVPPDLVLPTTIHFHTVTALLSNVVVIVLTDLAALVIRGRAGMHGGQIGVCVAAAGAVFAPDDDLARLLLLLLLGQGGEEAVLVHHGRGVVVLQLLLLELILLDHLRTLKRVQ